VPDSTHFVGPKVDGRALNAGLAVDVQSAGVHADAPIDRGGGGGDMQVQRGVHELGIGKEGRGVGPGAWASGAAPKYRLLSTVHVVLFVPHWTM